MTCSSLQLMLLYAIWGYNVKSVFSGEYISARVGNTVLLPCQLHHPDPDPPPHVIEWSRPDSALPVFIKIGGYPARINSHFKGRMSLLKNSASLRIREVRISDEGWYVCRILYLRKSTPTDDDLIRNGTWIKLVVTARPTITSAPPSTYVAKENESLLLRCSIEGKPKPEIRWRKDDRLLINGKDGYLINGGHLSVTSLQKKHRGNYKCIGRNSEGQVEYTTRVHVKAPPELNVAPKNLTLKESVDAFFTCKATGYPENITYSWLYNENRIKDVTTLVRRYNVISDGTFVIYDVNRHDSGQVTCKASNGYGEPVEASAYLIVQYRARPLEMPSIAYGGLSLPVTLPCASEGEPPVNIVTWRKNGKVIGSKRKSRVRITADGSLHINNMLRYDMGSYTCTPYNILGSTGESGQVQLIAKDPPAFTLRPQEEVEAEIGKPLSLLCTGVGDPRPRLSWRKVGSDLGYVAHRRLFWHGGNFTITSLTKEDHGLWQCVMTNPVAEMTSDVQINVKYTTPHVITNVSAVMSHNSASIKWLPGYDGGYPQHFMIWFKRADQGDHMWSTRSVNRSHTRAVVNRLDAETVYQFAVLAENVLGSGKFSKTVTAKTQALPTEAPVIQRLELPAPYGLKICKNAQGIIILSWKVQRTVVAKNLLGFLVEYRISNDGSAPATNNIKCNSSSRKRRHTFSVLRTKRSAKFVNHRESLARASGNSGNTASTWDVLAAYPANTSSIKIDSEQLFQDQYYELHVLAVTPSAYSSPSKSVYIDTTGLLFYALPLSASVNAAVLSGIISGVIFVAVTFTIAICFCFNRRKDYEEAKAKWNKSTLCEEKIDCDEMKSCSQSSNATSHTVATSSKYAIDDRIIIKKKKGMFQKLKYKLEKNKQNPDEAHSVNHCYLKAPKASSKDSPVRKLGPIYRSPDGKFHVSDSKNVRKIDHKSRRNEVSLLNKQSFEASHTELDAKNVKMTKNRPISDSILHNHDVEPGKMMRRKYSEQGRLDEDAAEASLEIDCSQSDIEVRFVAAGQNMTGIDRNNSPFRPPGSVSHQMFHHLSNQNKPIYVKDDPSITKYSMTSFTSDPSLHPRLSVAHSNQYIRPFSPFLPPADYVFLKDIGIPCADTPMSDITHQTCYSPMVKLISSHTTTPSDLPRYKYHSHALVPGGHYHLTPRASYAAPSSGHWVDFKPPRLQESLSQRPAHSRETVRSPLAVESSQACLHSNLPNIAQAQLDKNLTREKNEKHVKPSLNCQDVKSISSIINAIPNEQCYQEVSKNIDEPSDNYPIASSSVTNRKYRSHSWSLPTLAHRKSSMNSPEKQKHSGKRFASTDDVLMKSDTDSDKGFSFTSGSASTVRFVASKDSNLTLTGADNLAVQLSPIGSLSDFHPPKHSVLNQLSASPVLPSSETGGGSCSGYESQNTSSETSSHCLKTRVLSNNGRLFCHEMQDVTQCCHSHSNNDPSICKASSSEETHNHLLLTTHNACSTNAIRASTASSDESRSRRDNSSVDDKYEWDSEFAMESEILEALKNLESHNREKPVSNNILQELQKLRVNRSDVTSPPLNPTSPLLEDEDESLLATPSDDSSYSKEKMEKRCADLKKEYLEYKRLATSQQHNSSPQKSPH